MDKERIKGKAQDVAGRVERQVGEWTGKEKAQAEGMARQAEGKARNAVGKMKDKVRDAAESCTTRKSRKKKKKTARLSATSSVTTTKTPRNLSHVSLR